LKLRCDEPVSNFAFNFNLRRYTPADWANQGAGTSDPNGLIADRPEVRLGANRAPGACRPRPDSLNFDDGTAVVGTPWGTMPPPHPSTERRGKAMAPRGGGQGGCDSMHFPSSSSSAAHM
jgi:hypothetical protein